MKVRYEIAAKLEPLCHLYRDNNGSLKTKVNGLFIIFVYLFQGLAIIWQYIDRSAYTKENLVIKMVKNIEYPLFSST